MVCRYVGQGKRTNRISLWHDVRGQTANINIMAWTVWGYFLGSWNIALNQLYWHDIDLWQQHTFVRAKLSWNGMHPEWRKTMLFHIYPKGTFKDSDKELGPFWSLRSVVKWFFVHFVIWCSWCCESWVWHPSRWARHSEWNIVVVKVNHWTHFCLFCVADDMGIVKQMFVWFLLENCRFNMANFLIHAYHW